MTPEFIRGLARLVGSVESTRDRLRLTRSVADLLALAAQPFDRTAFVAEADAAPRRPYGLDDFHPATTAEAIAGHIGDGTLLSVEGFMEVEAEALVAAYSAAVQDRLDELGINVKCDHTLH